MEGIDPPSSRSAPPAASSDAWIPSASAPARHGKPAELIYRLRFFVPAVLALLAVGTLLWSAFKGRPPAPATTILGNGILEATEVDVSTKVAGRVVTLRVREGDTVRTGQLIASLDGGELEGQVEQAVGNLEAAKAALAELQAGTRGEEIRRLRAEYEASHRALLQAEANRDLVHAGTRKEQIAQAGAAYRQAQEELSLVRQGPRKEQVAQLRAAYEQAEAHLSLVQEGPRAEQVRFLQAAYEQALARRALVKAGPRQEVVDRLRADLRQAEATRIDAQRELARYEQLFADRAVAAQERDRAQTARDVAQARVEAAREQLREAEAGPRPDELREADQQVEAARQKLAEAQAGARRQEIQGAVKQVEAARQKLAEAEAGARPQEIQAAEARAELARQKLAEAEAGARPEELRAVEALVAQARSRVSAARAELDLALAGPRKETIASAAARVRQASGGRKTAVATEEHTRLSSPVAGRVLLRNVEPGELVTPGLPLVRIAEIRRPWLRVYIPEPEVGRLKVGQKAEVTVDAFPGKRFRGRVVEIAEKPEYTPKNVQTREERVKLVFGVKIEVDNPEDELKPGMPGDATIFVGPLTGP